MRLKVMACLRAAAARDELRLRWQERFTQYLVSHYFRFLGIHGIVSWRRWQLPRSSPCFPLFMLEDACNALAEPLFNRHENVILNCELEGLRRACAVQHVEAGLHNLKQIVPKQRR